MPVDLVVLVLPNRSATLAAVFGDSHRAMFVRHRAVRALHELGVTLGAPPVLLHAGAGLAHLGGDGGLGAWG